MLYICLIDTVYLEIAKDLMTKCGALFVASPLPVNKNGSNQGEGTSSFRGFKLSLIIVFLKDIVWILWCFLLLKVVKQKIVALRLEFVARPTFFCATGDYLWFQTFVVSAFSSYVDSKMSRALLRSSEILVSYCFVPCGQLYFLSTSSTFF